MIIYDYNNNPVSVQLPDKEIKEIFVEVLSGDEVVSVEFTDGEILKFDSSNRRIMNFDDGCYRVTGHMIKKWMEFQPTPGKTASYERQWWFDDEQDIIDSELVSETLLIGGQNNGR